MWTEQQIRDGLDGKFVKVCYSGDLIETTVPLDFVPCYRPRAKATPEARAKRRLWTPEEDALLRSLVAQRVKQVDIARQLGRKTATVCARVRYIRETARREVTAC